MGSILFYFPLISERSWLWNRCTVRRWTVSHVRDSKIQDALVEQLSLPWEQFIDKTYVTCEKCSCDTAQVSMEVSFLHPCHPRCGSIGLETFELLQSSHRGLASILIKRFEHIKLANCKPNTNCCLIKIVRCKQLFLFMVQFFLLLIVL